MESVRRVKLIQFNRGPCKVAAEDRTRPMLHPRETRTNERAERSLFCSTAGVQGVVFHTVHPLVPVVPDACIYGVNIAFGEDVQFVNLSFPLPRPTQRDRRSSQTIDAKTMTRTTALTYLAALTGATALTLPQAPQHVRARPVVMVATFSEDLNAKAATKNTVAHLLDTLRLDALRERLEGKLSPHDRLQKSTSAPSEFTQMCHERSIETAQRNAKGVLPYFH